MELLLGIPRAPNINQKRKDHRKGAMMAETRAQRAPAGYWMVTFFARLNFEAIPGHERSFSDRTNGHRSMADTRLHPQGWTGPLKEFAPEG